MDLPLSSMATTELACVFAHVFFPDFVEHRGGVFLKEKFDKNTADQWFDSEEGDVSKVEAVVESCSPLGSL